MCPPLYAFLSVRTANSPSRFYFNIYCSKSAADRISILPPRCKIFGSRRKSHGSPESVCSCGTPGVHVGRNAFTVHSRAHQRNILPHSWRHCCSLWTPTAPTLPISTVHTCIRSLFHFRTHSPQPLFPRAALSFLSLMGGEKDVNRQENVKDSHSCPV